MDTIERDTMQDDTDAGMWAYFEAHMDEFRVIQVLHAFR